MRLGVLMFFRHKNMEPSLTLCQRKSALESFHANVKWMKRDSKKSTFPFF